MATKRTELFEAITRALLSRRDLLQTAGWAAVLSVSGPLTWAAYAQDSDAEPENLDEPTAWQEGDPEPVEATIPAVEPEQTSSQAPPSQPMDDVRADPPNESHVWATGYWWWNNGSYVWVPGYWAVPPQPEHVYVAGYWTYHGSSWVYVRGGWGAPNTTIVVVYPKPRPILTVFVITAPIRIIRRNRRWRHHHSRRYSHRKTTVNVNKNVNVNVNKGGPSSKPGSPAGGSKPGGPITTQGRKTPSGGRSSPGGKPQGGKGRGGAGGRPQGGKGRGGPGGGPPPR